MTTSSAWVDFQVIKKTISIEMVLQHYGLLQELRRKKDELSGLCPFPNHQDTRASFSANTEKNNFQCFGCKAKGNVLDFVAVMEGVNIREAGLMLKDRFDTTQSLETSDGNLRQAQPRETIIVAPEIINTPLSFKLKSDPSHPYLRERGLTPGTISEFGLGFCSRGLMQGRIAIPIHDEDGQLVAYAGRWPGDPPEEEPRYKLPGEFRKDQVVFNLHRASQLARKEKSLVVVEGFFPCFWLSQAGLHNVVALMGSSLSTNQKELIIDRVGPDGQILLLFDNNEAGEFCRQQCLNELSWHVAVRSLRFPGGCVQPDDMTPEQIQELLALP